MCVVADFSKIRTIDEYVSTIGVKVKDLDIGVLAVNAGYFAVGPIAD